MLTEVYVRFLDPNMGRLSKVPVPSDKQDIVPIQASHFSAVLWIGRNCSTKNTDLFYHCRNRIPLQLLKLHKISGWIFFALQFVTNLGETNFISMHWQLF